MTTEIAPLSASDSPRSQLVRGPVVPFIDPATALSEVLFGLIMTLTFTLTAGIIITNEGGEGARQLLIAVLGCNIAWGIIDAALYLVGELLNRGRMRKLGVAIRASSDQKSAATLVASELDPLLEDTLGRDDRETLYARIALNVRERPERRNTITREDWMGALMSFALVVISSLPAALPFLLLDDAHLALRLSNAVLVALLFVTGYWWARFTLGKPWIVGLSFLCVGLLLVVAAVALGG